MKTFTVNSTTAAALLLAVTGTALAQSDFQLPRECIERQVANPERCVIQDGPPRLPLVRNPLRSSTGAGSQAPLQSPTNTAPAATPPAARLPALASAPFAARR